MTIPGDLREESLHLRTIQYSKSKRISLGDFKIIKTLGSGGFSNVYLVRAKFNGCFYALKLMKKDFIL
jgi:serum/glucocorticoid-regulated kinase 2